MKFIGVKDLRIYFFLEVKDNFGQLSGGLSAIKMEFKVKGLLSFNYGCFMCH